MQEQNRKSSFPIVMLLVSVALWIASLSNVAFYLGNHESMKALGLGAGGFQCESRTRR